MKHYDIEKQVLSIEQCSILEKLGYDLDNATHCWVYDDSTGYKFICLSSDAVDYHSSTTVITPTWNLQECMYEILKKCIGYTCPKLLLEGDQSTIEIGDYDGPEYSEIAENTIDACFRMLQNIGQRDFDKIEQDIFTE